MILKNQCWTWGFILSPLYSNLVQQNDNILSAISARHTLRIKTRYLPSFHKRRLSHILTDCLSETGSRRVDMTEHEAKAQDHLVLATGEAVGSKLFLGPYFRGKRWCWYMRYLTLVWPFSWLFLAAEYPYNFSVPHKMTQSANQHGPTQALLQLNYKSSEFLTVDSFVARSPSDSRISN